MSKQLWCVISSLVLITLLVSACKPTTPPPQPNRPQLTPTLVSTKAPPTATLVPTRTPLWTFQTEGAVWSTPTVAEGIVYFGSDDHRLYAVNAKTGLEKWHFETGGLVRSHPALAKDAVYFTSDDGFLYALEAASGQQLWKLDIGNAITARQALGMRYDYLQSSPVIDQGLIYTGSVDGNLYAVDAFTGQEKWRFQAAGKIRSSPVVANDLVYVGDWTDILYALDSQTGMEKWRFQGCGDQPTPTVVDGVVYVGGRSTYLYALDALNGQKKWSFKMGNSWVESSATLVDNLIYIGSSDAYRLYVLDKNTGQELWEFSTTGAYPWSTPAVRDNMVYLGSAKKTSSTSPHTCTWSGCLRAIDARTQTEIWQIAPGETIDTSGLGGVVSSPVLAEGVVYFGGMDGNLYAVSTAP